MIHLRKTSHLLSDHHLAGSTPQTTYSRDRARSRSIGPRLGDRSTRAERVDGHRGWGSAPGAPVRALWVKSLELGAFLKWSSHVWVYSVHLGLHSSFGCPSRPSAVPCCHEVSEEVLQCLGRRVLLVGSRREPHVVSRT